MLSPVVEKDINQYYQARNGNPNGIPVVVMGINTDETSKERTDQFIREIGFKLVVDDPSWTSYAQFGPGGSAARYVIINGVADSPSHKQWEVLFNANYFDYRRPDLLRKIIDSVKGPAPTPPIITSAPKSQTASQGGSVTLTVAAAGTAPLTYQWQKSGTPIPGATAQTLFIAKVVPSDAGDYSVVVSNAVGSVTSPVTNLKVLEPVRPALNRLRRMDGGGVEFVLSVELGRTYHVEFSTDLKSWKRIATLNAGEQPIIYRDADAASATQGFYRALSE